MKHNTNEYILTPVMPQDALWEPTSALTQTVGEGFKCSICEKSFEQRSSRDRHLRRCRQKQLTGTIPRKKSCALCTQAKTRCDLRTPACSRCKAKGLNCQYYAPPIHVAQTPTPAPAPPSSPPVQTPREEVSFPTPAPTDPEHVEDADEPNFDPSLGDVAIVDWGEISNSLFDWGPMFGPVGATNHGAETLEASLHTPQTSGSHGSISSLCTNEHNTPIAVPEQFRPVGQLSRLVSVESFTHMRHRLTTEPVSAKTNHFNKFNFMNRVIRPYPKMIATGNILPPFIHPSSLLPGKVPEALANCKGLVEMYKTMTQDNRQFVMKTIRQEHDRLLQQYMGYSDSEMLSMLQAALIYGMIRHFEDDTTMDRPTLMQIETMAFNVGLGGLMARGELEGTRPVWEEWVLAESKRRTLLTLYMFDASFHYSRGLETLTSHELGELPLPGIRYLWEGMDRVKWEHDYEGYLTALKGERLPRIQDAWSPSSTLLDEWYAGMDSFGVTVLALCEDCSSREGCSDKYICYNRHGT